MPMQMRKLSKREKSCLGLLGAGAATLMLSSGEGGAGGRALFNPDAGSAIRRALAAPMEEIRGLNLVVTGYDTSETKTLPSFYENFKDVWDGLIPDDRAMMWYVPKAGGNTFTKVMGKCLGMTTLSAMSMTVEDGLLPEDRMVVKYNETIGNYVNVDPCNPEGIAKAKSYNAMTGGLVDVLVTQRLEDSAQLFTSVNRGRLFAMLRHPIKRAADQFYYRQRATWDNFDPTLAQMSIDEFASSDRLIENFMVRSLVGKASLDVNQADVDLAKDILRRKFIIGIAEPTWFDLSVVRFEKYFGWWEDKEVLTNHTVNYCHHHEITNGNHFGNHPKLLPRSQAYAKIAVRNWADLELFMYAKNTLYKQQAIFI